MQTMRTCFKFKFKSILFLFMFVSLAIVFLNGVKVSSFALLALSSVLTLLLLFVLRGRVKLDISLQFWLLSGIYLLLRTNRLDVSALSYEITFLLMALILALCNSKFIANFKWIYRALFWMSLTEMC